MVLLIIGAALIAATLGYLVWRGSGRRERKAYHFRCPGCDLLVRYSAASAGRRIQCPRCLRASTLNPYAPEDSQGKTAYRYRPHRLRRR